MSQVGNRRRQDDASKGKATTALKAVVLIFGSVLVSFCILRAIQWLIRLEFFEFVLSPVPITDANMLDFLEKVVGLGFNIAIAMIAVLLAVLGLVSARATESITNRQYELDHAEFRRQVMLDASDAIKDSKSAILLDQINDTVRFFQKVKARALSIPKREQSEDEWRANMSAAKESAKKDLEQANASFRAAIKTILEWSDIDSRNHAISEVYGVFELGLKSEMKSCELHDSADTYFVSRGFQIIEDIAKSQVSVGVLTRKLLQETPPTIGYKLPLGFDVSAPNENDHSDDVLPQYASENDFPSGDYLPPDLRTGHVDPLETVLSRAVNLHDAETSFYVAEDILVFFEESRNLLALFAEMECHTFYEDNFAAWTADFAQGVIVVGLRLCSGLKQEMSSVFGTDDPIVKDTLDKVWNDALKKAGIRNSTARFNLMKTPEPGKQEQNVSMLNSYRVEFRRLKADQFGS
jgi:hypothetical protein